MNSLKRFKEEFEEFVYNEDKMVYQEEPGRSIRKRKTLPALELDVCPEVIELLETLLKSAKRKDEELVKKDAKVIKKEVAAFLTDHSYAFDLLSQFAINLIRQPWKYMDMPIKTYTAMYNNYIERFGFTKILIELGYKKEQLEWTFEQSHYNKNKLMELAFDLHVAALECEIILELFKDCNGKKSLEEICRNRMYLKGDKSAYDQGTRKKSTENFKSKSADMPTSGHIASNNEDSSMNGEGNDLPIPPSPLQNSSEDEGEKKLHKKSDKISTSETKELQSADAYPKVSPERATESRGTGERRTSALLTQQDSQKLHACKCGTCITGNETMCHVCRIEMKKVSTGNSEQKHSGKEVKKDSAKEVKKDSAKDLKSEQLKERKESETRMSDGMPKDKSITGAGCRDEEVVYAKRNLATNRWHCGPCKHLNSGDNVFCEKCGQEPVFKDENVLGALKDAPANPSRTIRRNRDGIWQCPKCNKWNGGAKCYDCTFVPVFEVTREYTGSRFKTPQGDWVAHLTGMYWCCPNCNGQNHKDIKVCGTCQIVPRFIDTKHDVSVRIAVQETPTVRRDSNGKWTCPKCSKWNGGMKCYRCTFQVSSENPPGGVLRPQGDWTVEINGMFWRCPNCEVENIYSLTVCNTCKIAPRSIKTVRELTNKRDSKGNWKCPQCPKLNGGTKCYNCPLVPHVAAADSISEGDWDAHITGMVWCCPNCKGENHKDIVVCDTCKIAPHSFIESSGTYGNMAVREKLTVLRNSFGEWQCPKCSKWKSDRECYECKVVPRFASTSEGAVAGDEKRREGWVVQRKFGEGWECPKCRGKNISTDDKCYTCEMKPTFITKV